MAVAMKAETGKVKGTASTENRNTASDLAATENRGDGVRGSFNGMPILPDIE
jgi:hypothetical protein